MVHVNDSCSSSGYIAVANAEHIKITNLAANTDLTDWSYKSHVSEVYFLREAHAGLMNIQDQVFVY